MAYGIEINTPDGVRNLLDILSAQLVYEETHTSQTSSDSVPGGVTSSNAVGVCLPLDDKLPLHQVEVTTDTVSWSPDATFPSSTSFTSDFIIRVYRVL